MSDYKILVQTRADAERFWRYVQQSWDIGPAVQDSIGWWIITIPARVDLAHLLMAFLREEFNFSLVKDLNAE